MLKPDLTARQQQIMMMIGNKKPADCDSVETHVRKKVAELSHQLEQSNARVHNLTDQLEQAKRNQQILLGKFLAVAELAEDHSMEKVKSRPKCSQCGASFPGDPKLAEGGVLTCDVCLKKAQDAEKPQPTQEENNLEACSKKVQDAEESPNDPGQPDPAQKEERPEASTEEPES